MRRTYLSVLALALSLASCSHADTSKSSTLSSNADTDAVAGTTVSPSASSGGAPSRTGVSAATPGSVASATSAPIPPAITTKPASVIPASGTYVYAQDGNESICSGAACSTPRPLPQQMTQTLSRPAPAQVVIDWQIASGRQVRLTTTFGSESISLQELYVQFSEAGISRSGTVRPQPQIKIASLPLKAGSSWKGSYSAESSSGTYSFKVLSPETIKAAGAQRKSDPVEGTVTFSGKENGTLHFTAWIDPRTNIFLRADGDIDLHSAFSGYKATFTDSLSSGPSY